MSVLNLFGIPTTAFEVGRRFSAEFGGVTIFGVVYPTRIEWVNTNGIVKGARNRIANFLGDTFMKYGYTGVSVSCTSFGLSGNPMNGTNSYALAFHICATGSPTIAGGEVLKGQESYTYTHRVYSPKGVLVDLNVVPLVNTAPVNRCPADCTDWNITGAFTSTFIQSAQANCIKYIPKTVASSR